LRLPKQGPRAREQIAAKLFTWLICQVIVMEHSTLATK